MDFKYTKAYYPDSSWVHVVYFNENDNTAVLDLYDKFYRYTGVNTADVAALVGADSVGEYYNSEFSRRFGPAEFLGNRNDLEWDIEPVRKETAGTAKGLTVPAGVVTVAQGTNATPAPVRVEQSSTAKTTVFFNLDENDREYSFEANSSDPAQAVEERTTHVSVLGAKGRVRKVVLEFA